MNQKFLLDTNVLSELMRTEPEKKVLVWFEANTNNSFYISSITQAEILLGIALLPDGKKKSKLINASDKLFSEDFANRIYSFDDKSAAIYADIVSNRIHSGHPITTEDAQIASIAMSNNLFLVTRNEKDFLWIDNLSIVNPWDFDISKKE